MSKFPSIDGSGTQRTPWAVTCAIHGLGYLDKKFYEAQLDVPDQFWLCPICGLPSAWSDDNYEECTGASLELELPSIQHKKGRNL